MNYTPRSRFLAPWLENHLPALVTDGIHNFLHQLGHRVDADNENNHQIVARLKGEKADMASDNIVMLESKQARDVEIEGLRNENAGLRRELADQIKQARTYQDAEEGQKERLQETVEARGRKLEEITTYHDGQARKCRKTNWKLEEQVKDLRSRLDSTNVRDEIKINNLTTINKRQEDRIEGLEKRAEESRQDQVAFVRKLKDGFEKDGFEEYAHGCREIRTKLEKTIKELQADNKGLRADMGDHARGVEEMWEQASADMLEKEELKEGMKEQESRAGAAEKLVNDLVEELRARQSRVGAERARANVATANITVLEAVNADLEERLAAAKEEITRIHEEYEKGSCSVM
ncbi:MAG: hypothetical protein Q9216_002592 [Gyalolechia sp. 2 TL-2023]